MNRCWAQFARTGNPNAVGLPTWPTYTMEQRQYLVLNHEITQGTRLRDKVCDVLDRAIQGVYNKPPAGN
jgi:carboxylesterase type B